MCERSEGAHLGSEHPPQLILEDGHFNLVVEELLAELEHELVEVRRAPVCFAERREVRERAELEGRGMRDGERRLVVELHGEGLEELEAGPEDLGYEVR